MKRYNQPQEIRFTPVFILIVLVFVVLLCTINERTEEISNRGKIAQDIQEMKVEIKNLKIQVDNNKKYSHVLTVNGYVLQNISHIDICQKWAKKTNIPLSLVLTVQILETGHLPFNKRDKAVSKVGAIGIMQIMPSLGKIFKYKKQSLYNPEINIEISCRFLSDLFKKYNGNIEKVLAYYNGGNQADLPQVKRCYETRSYVTRGLKIYKQLKYVEDSYAK